MKTRSIVWVLLAACAALCGCKERIHGETPAGVEKPPTDGDELAEANMTGPRPRGMASCPSAVPDAVTKLRATPEGVELVVTAANKHQVHEILERAHHLARVGFGAEGAVRRPVAPNVNPEPAPGVEEHTGKGTGGGKMGYCPVVVVSTDVTVEPVDGGARIIVRAIEPLDVATLQKVTAARVQALPKVCR